MSTATETGLSATALETVVRAISTDSRVEKIVLFGSRAKGTWYPGSDIDLAVYGCAIKHEDLSRWKERLEELLFPWSVDMVEEDQIANAALRAHIERVGVVLFERDPPA